MKSLTPKHALFVREYLVDLNATQAAIRAGYSPKTANKNVSRLMVNEGIQKAIAVGQEEIKRASKITEEEIDAREACLLRFNPADLYHPDGSKKHISELPREVAACLKGHKEQDLYEHFGKGGAKKVGTITDYRYVDPDKALELAMRRRGMLTDNVKHEGLDSILAQVTEILRSPIKQ